MENKRTCPICGDPVKGRIDKRFCTDQCRAEFNNQINKESINLMRRINSILRRNRRILVTMDPGDNDHIARNHLADRGFDFRYFTSISDPGNGKTCFFCYEQGYQQVDHEHVRLTCREMHCRS